MKLAPLAVLFLAIPVYAQDAKPTPPAATAPKAEAKPETKDPPAAWLTDYESYLALQKTIADLKADAGIDKLEAKLGEKGQKLVGSIEPGFHFDPATRKWVANPKPEEPKKPAK